MKKSSFSKSFRVGTFEYIVMHALWQRSRGKNLSATFLGERNPRKALALAKRFAYFPKKDGIYVNGRIPENYKCSTCGAVECKLWRRYESSPSNLLCARCAAESQKKDISDIDVNGSRKRERIGGRTDQIGWYVPAIPAEDDFDTYWGYTSVPNAGCEWWYKLPTLSIQP